MEKTTEGAKAPIAKRTPRKTVLASIKEQLAEIRAKLEELHQRIQKLEDR